VSSRAHPGSSGIVVCGRRLIGSTPLSLGLFFLLLQLDLPLLGTVRSREMFVAKGEALPSKFSVFLLHLHLRLHLHHLSRFVICPKSGQ